MAYEIDYSAWPLVRVRADGRLSTDTAHIAVSAFEAILARRQPFAVAYDGGDSAPTPEDAGPIVWNWIDEHRGDLDAYCVAWANYMPDDQRRAATEQHYSRKAGMPLRAFATWRETEDWAGNQVKVTVPH